jgi:hypothetical protein
MILYSLFPQTPKNPGRVIDARLDFRGKGTLSAICAPFILEQHHMSAKDARRDSFEVMLAEDTGNWNQVVEFCTKE